MAMAQVIDTTIASSAESHNSFYSDGPKNIQVQVGAINVKDSQNISQEPEDARPRDSY